MGRLHRQQKLWRRVPLEVWGSVSYSHHSRLRLVQERAMVCRRQLQRGAQPFPPGVLWAQLWRSLRRHSMIITQESQFLLLFQLLIKRYGIYNTLNTDEHSNHLTLTNNPKAEKSENARLNRTTTYLWASFHQSFPPEAKTRVHRWTVRCPPASPELRWFPPSTGDTLALQQRGAPCCLHSSSKTTMRTIFLNSAFKTCAKVVCLNSRVRNNTPPSVLSLPLFSKS